jgi:hypothetical protein
LGVPASAGDSAGEPSASVAESAHVTNNREGDVFLSSRVDAIETASSWPEAARGTVARLARGSGAQPARGVSAAGRARRQSVGIVARRVSGEVARARIIFDTTLHDAKQRAFL